MTEQEFALKIDELGGNLYIVGGWVRDLYRKAIPKDKDYVICHLSEEAFITNFPRAKKIGKSFPVYLVNIEGKDCEIAFARKERKQGIGYTGFTIEYNEQITIEEDLWRRDTTMNSIAYNILTEQFIDPYCGKDDIRKKVVRAVSQHFKEDPVRALRAARQACELDFYIDEETIKMMRDCKLELVKEPKERIFNELQRALKTAKPSQFFRNLLKADLLDITFPELFALIGKTQPIEYHPEGDAFEHTMEIVDLVATMTDDLAVRFAGLVHDLGKGRTPLDMLPHHYGHEVCGQEVLIQWNKKMTLPKKWLQGGLFVIKEHMRAARLEKVSKIVDFLLLVEKNPLGFEGFNKVILADSKCLPYYLADYQSYLSKLHSITIKDCPKHLKGKAIGQWIRNEQIRIFKDNIAIE